MAADDDRARGRIAGRVSSPVRVAHVTTVDLTLRFLLLDQLTRLRDEGFEVTGVSAPGPWTADLEAEGITHVPWSSATRAWDPVADIRAFRSLLAILRAGRFDIVHTHTPKPGVLGRIAARRARVPHVVNTVHGFYATPEDRLLKRALVLGAERVAARFSDLELFQSEEDLHWALRAGVVARDQGVLLGNGVDLHTFDPGAVPAGRTTELRRDLGIPDAAVVVGTVGRFVAEKGYRELIAAAREVRAGAPETRFLALGAEDPAKRDAITSPEIDRARKDVVFVGWRPDVRDYLAVMDVFVLASWREGLPRSAIEAAAMAKPLVLTDIRGCREVVRDGSEGFLVPPRDPRALAGAIARLAADRALRERLGTAARARAEARFDGRRVADIVVASYRRLLARGVSGSRSPGSPPAGAGDGEAGTGAGRADP